MDASSSVTKSAARSGDASSVKAARKLSSARALNNPRTFNNALIPDTDGDGLDDEMESLLGTNFRNPDTDGDGVSDGVEVQRGEDPTRRPMGQ